MTTTFPHFTQLPAELRCKIWHYALPQRTVFFQLKMDMEAWNWAPESDWWAHYLLAGDYSPQATPQQPALLRVNHEARAELLRSYKRLRINKALLKRCLDDDSVEDYRLERMRFLSRAPSFNVDTDILEWAHVKRWSRNSPIKCGALFLAASMSVQHITVEYDHYLHTSLVALALSVLDVDSPLRSLTLKVADSNTNDCHAFRIAQLPDHVTYLSRGASSRELLDVHGACMLPWYRRSFRDTETLLSRTLDRSTLEAFSRPLAPGTRLGTSFAIFRSISPQVAEQEDAWIPSEETKQSWRWTEMVEEDERRQFNTSTSLQDDVALFMHRLSLYEQWDDDDRQQHHIDIVPFHGVCLASYGLP